MLTAALVLAQAQLYYPLKWEPKKGATHVYEFFLKDKESSVEASVEHKVTDVSRDGSYSVRSRSLGALVRIAGSEIRDDRPNESTATFDDRGRLKEIKGGTTGLEKYRSALLTNFVCNTGDGGGDAGTTWTYERAKDEPSGLPACKIEYKITSAKKGDPIVEVQFTFTELGGEHPQMATGKWWVDCTTRVPQKMEAKVKNFVGTQSGETEIKLVLRKP
jgi:hypothetical protein